MPVRSGGYSVPTSNSNVGRSRVTHAKRKPSRQPASLKEARELASSRLSREDGPCKRTSARAEPVSLHLRPICWKRVPSFCLETRVIANFNTSCGPVPFIGDEPDARSLPLSTGRAGPVVHYAAVQGEHL